MTNEQIIEAIASLYPELHEVRNALDPLGPEPHSNYGNLRHTLGNLLNILEYYEQNKKDKLSN